MYDSGDASHVLELISGGQESLESWSARGGGGEVEGDSSNLCSYGDST